MKCREAEGQFSEFLSEKAPKELLRRIKVHLKGCKRCQGRLDRLKKKEAVAATIEAADDSPQIPALSPTLSAAPESHAAPEAPAIFPGSPSPLRFMPVLTAAMTLLIVSALYFFTQGSTDADTNSLIDRKSLLPAVSFPATTSIEAGPGAETPVAPPSFAPGEAEGSPIPKKVGNGKPHDLLPKKAGNGKPHDLSGGAREKTTLKAPPVKLLLISRDLKEAIEEIQLRTVQSDGKILEKKEGDLEAKFVLLIPAPQYDAFFNSLQQLGLTKETSKKTPPTEGSLKLELTVE